MHKAIVVCALMVAVSAAGQELLSFYPRTAVPEGGTEIQLRSSRHYRQFNAPQVFFGDVPAAQTTLVASNSITAVTPPHPIGIVTIRVVDDGETLEGDDFVFEPEYEEILIPVALNAVDAGHGTRWVSEISVYNDSDERISIDPEICWSLGSPVPCSYPTRWVEPHSSLAIEPRWSSLNQPAMLVMPPANRADHLHFTVRLHELSRNPDGPGLQIPVVRASQFQRTKVWLPSVPTTAGHRSALRIYTRSHEVAVRVRDEATGELLQERVIERWIPTDTDSFGTVSVHDLLSSPDIAIHPRVRIEVEGRFPVWAMLSLTNNETQRVELFTPQ